MNDGIISLILRSSWLKDLSPLALGYSFDMIAEAIWREF